jgi:hypothetical protein
MGRPTGEKVPVGNILPLKALHEFRALAWWLEGSAISKRDFRAMLAQEHQRHRAR